MIIILLEEGLSSGLTSNIKFDHDQEIHQLLVSAPGLGNEALEALKMSLQGSARWERCDIRLYRRTYKSMRNSGNKHKELSPKLRQELLRVLMARFEKNVGRHKGVDWANVQARLEAHSEKLWSLNEMERTGGEPDVVRYDRRSGVCMFVDCSAESPKGRRSICYDREAQDGRKEFKPDNNAMDMAAAMGVELLSEEQYRELQELGNFDTKTSSWVKTPSDIRRLGGALFADRRYGKVFVYHNGASSYYAVRGFRAFLSV
jgi:hypothetical protein